MSAACFFRLCLRFFFSLWTLGKLFLFSVKSILPSRYKVFLWCSFCFCTSAKSPPTTTTTHPTPLPQSQNPILTTPDLHLSPPLQRRPDNKHKYLGKQRRGPCRSVFFRCVRTRCLRVIQVRAVSRPPHDTKEQTEIEGRRC